MTDSRNYKKERGPAVWLSFKTILLLCLWQCWKPDAVCYSTAQQVETGQRLQLHIPHLVSMAIWWVVSLSISLSSSGLSPLETVGHFFPLWDKHLRQHHISHIWCIWPSVWSVSVAICLISECRHLSDQWVWPSVWSVSVAICLISECGHLFDHWEWPLVLYWTPWGPLWILFCRTLQKAFKIPV